MTMNHDDLLTPEERQRVEEFLSVFSDIESLIKNRLEPPPDSRNTVTRLINDYLERNPYWSRDASELRHLKDIRNFLTHERTQECGYPVAVTRRSLNRLKVIKQTLARPVPISTRHKKHVFSLAPTQSLADVLRIAYEKRFSQFPVVDERQFRGLITENEITRWLGSQAKRSTVVDLARVTVRQVLREKEPDRRHDTIFRFCASDVPEAEVMGFFQKHPTLEVVLLTRTGKKDSPIEGIVTQWDAARYPPAI
jgi:predicted transcriptional regulator